MGLFDLLFGRKKSSISPMINIEKIKEDIKKDISTEIIKENDALRHDLSLEIKKIHNMIELDKDSMDRYDGRIKKIMEAVYQMNAKFADLAVMGQLAIENRERLDKYSRKIVTKEELEALRHEVLNISALAQTDIEDHPEMILETKLQSEPKASLAEILEQLPNSRRALVNILLHAESPISYKQIATKMGLTYNTVKVYVRDIRESGFPIEEYIAQNKKLLNIPNSVKATLLYNQ
ncbi:MAG: HTH domain-containing protein [archaeon]